MLLKGQIVRNASWIIFSKIFQSILAFVINLFTARYLGPSNYGLISYASSMVIFVMPIAYLGFNNTLVHEFSNAPEKEGAILGTSLLLGLISSFFCIIGCLSFTYVCNREDTTTVIVVAIYSLILIFQVLDLVQYWFQYKLLSKYSSLASLIAYVIVSVYKIFLLITRKSVLWFAASNVVDCALLAMMLIFTYKKLGGSNFVIDFSLGKSMFDKSKHYIVTGLMIAIFSQTDKIMLKEMLDVEATGHYSAAVSLAMMPGFIYAAIIDSFRPVIFKSQDDEPLFLQNMKCLYSIVIYLSLLQSVIMTVLSSFIVKIVYGDSYYLASPALKIVVWYVTFSYLGSIRNIWILSKEKQKYLWIINMSGAILNVFTNLLLIPIWGINGAAIASFLTQFFSNFVLGFILTPIRENNKIILSSLNPMVVINSLKTIEREY